ncbi:MAG: cysteine hydrolase [Candidatus Binatia bacterium]|jgi:ureidoacrylate peracid hydrolase|nr:cysteine hydrolase [Candidatus Binatia bacterium]
MQGDKGRPADGWVVAPKNTALIVIDMQKTWVHPRGARYLPSSEEMIPKLKEVLSFCRTSKLPVIFLHTIKRKDLAEAGIFADLKPETHRPDDPWSNFEEAPGAEFHDSIRPKPGEITINKFRYNGFYGTELENILRRLGCNTIAISGVATNVCCGSTARDGAMRDFKVLFLSDCNAAFTEEEHQGTLDNFAKHFGLVLDSKAFIDRVRSATDQRIAG